MHYQRLRSTGDVGGAQKKDMSGENNTKWRGGRVRGGQNGRYWMIFSPGHPNASLTGYVLEHRLIVEESLYRYLYKDEIVHHINHDPSDNRLENLEVTTRVEHARHHGAERHKNELGQFINAVLKQGEKDAKSGD